MILGGNSASQSLVNRIIKALEGGINIIHKSLYEEGEAKAYAAAKFLEISQLSQLSDQLIEIIAWSIGEYSPMHIGNLQEPVNRLCDLLDKTRSTFLLYLCNLYNPGTYIQCCIITSLLKLTAKSNSPFPQVIEVIERLGTSDSVEVQQVLESWEKRLNILIRDAAKRRHYWLVQKFLKTLQQILLMNWYFISNYVFSNPNR